MADNTSLKYLNFFLKKNTQTNMMWNWCNFITCCFGTSEGQQINNLLIKTLKVHICTVSTADPKKIIDPHLPK